MCKSKKARGPVKAEPLPGRQALEHRDSQVLESPVVWLADKRKDDNARVGVPANLWAVHGELYDLSSFAARHPGGAQWLTMTRGTDITELVETHHLNDAAVAAVLKKTRVGKAPKQEASKQRFTFSEKGFYKTLKRRAREVLGAEMKGHGPTDGMVAVSWTLLAGWACCFGAMCVASSTVTGVIAAVAAGVLLHALMGVGHNFFHQADTPWRFVFDLSLFNSYDWRLSHAISHHTYANTEIDVEVSGVEPFLYFLTNKPRNSAFVYVGFHLLCGLIAVVDCLRHHIGMATGKETMRREDALNWVQAALLVGTQGLRTGLLLFFVMHCLASYLLASLSFSVHRTEHAWTVGDADPELDFGRHIVKTTNEHSVDLGLMASFLCFAGLNYHILHHLFPTVDHSRLKSLDAVFKQTLREFNMTYRSFTFRQLYSGVFARHDMPLVAEIVAP